MTGNTTKRRFPTMRQRAKARMWSRAPVHLATPGWPPRAEETGQKRKHLKTRPADLEKQRILVMELSSNITRFLLVAALASVPVMGQVFYPEDAQVNLYFPHL